MNFKKIFGVALYYISVPTCVLCREKLDIDDRGLCKNCAEAYIQHKTRNCSRCAKVLSRCSCTNYRMRSHSVKKHIKVFRYLNTEQSLPGNNLIYSLKRDNRDDVADFLANELSEVIVNNLDLVDRSKYLITNVPRRKRSIIDFGYDHAAVLARSVAKKLGIKYRSLLISKSKRAQKETKGEARLRNAEFDYKRAKENRLKGITVIIIDDVVTTGASVSSCATLIRALGAREIIAASVASSYNDDYTPHQKTYS